MQWLLSLEIDTVTQVQNQENAVYILYSADTIENCINTTIFPPVMGK